MGGIKRFIYLLMSFSLFLTPLVAAHGNVLYNIDLDYDKELKTGVIEAAQSYLNIDEEPIQFDFDRELIHAKFDRRLEYSVFVNPVDYSIFGFRDDSLLTKDKKVNFDEKERKEIAQKIFDDIPEEYKSQLVYGEERKLYSGSFEYSWYRKVDNILVSGDNLKVEVDPSDGDVIAWRLSIFFYPKSQVITTPAISYKVAQKIAEIRFKAEPVEFKPILIIEGGKPVWITKVKSLYPYFVAVDALDGNVLYSGLVIAKLPEGYDYGREVEVVESDLIKAVYEG